MSPSESFDILINEKTAMAAQSDSVSKPEMSAAESPRVTIDLSSIPVFQSSVTVSYLAEGAANIIFRVTEAKDMAPVESPLESREPIGRLQPAVEPTAVPDENELSLPNEPILDGMLLRLRKQSGNEDGYSVGVKYPRQHQHWLTTIVPLFSMQNLVLQELIRLPVGLVEKLNIDLVDLYTQSGRPENRKGGQLDVGEEFGLLITDMTAAGEPEAEVLEVKPKWLAQSPNAPGDWKRCRNCALRERRRRVARRSIHDEATLQAMKAADAESEFCPWDLVSSDLGRTNNAISRLLGSSYRKSGRVDKTPSLDLVESIAAKLSEDGLLKRLRDLQTELDGQGPLKASTQDAGFLTAMTIRDCTMYVRVSGPNRFEVRLGDLDLKDGGGGRFERWKRVEQELVDEGWYTGTEEDAPETLKACDLS